MRRLITIYGADDRAKPGSARVWSRIDFHDGVVLCLSNTQIPVSPDASKAGIGDQVNILRSELKGRPYFLIAVRLGPDNSSTLDCFCRDGGRVDAPQSAKLLSLDGDLRNADLRQETHYNIPQDSILLVPNSGSRAKDLDQFIEAVDGLPSDIKTSVLYTLCEPQLETRINALEVALNSIAGRANDQRSQRVGMTSRGLTKASLASWAPSVLALVAISVFGVLLSEQLTEIEKRLATPPTAEKQVKKNTASGASRAEPAQSLEESDRNTKLAVPLLNAMLKCNSRKVKAICDTYQLQSVDRLHLLNSKDFAEAALKVEVAKSPYVTLRDRDMNSDGFDPSTGLALQQGKMVPSPAILFLVCQSKYAPFDPTPFYFQKNCQFNGKQVEVAFSELIRWLDSVGQSHRAGSDGSTVMQ